MTDFNKTLEQMESFRQGMNKGREMAIQQYDKAFVELDDKLNHIIRKLDTLLELKDK